MRDSTRDIGLGGMVTIAAGILLLFAGAMSVSAASEGRAADDGQASVSRTSTATQTSGTSSSSASSSSSSSSGSGQRGANVTRSGSSTSGGKAFRGRRGRPSTHYHYRGDYYRGSWGAFFGYYPWGYYYSYPYHYYPIFPRLYYGPYPYDYREARLGAVDLNVKPKKAEVWVDGQLVGPSGKFDGFPGYLWLERGKHEIIFHHPGFTTEVREVRVLEGAVIKVNMRMQPGESTLPEKVAKSRLGPAAPTGRTGDAGEEVRSGSAAQRKSVEPGRLRLAIEPADASVYLDGRFLGTGKELSALHSGLLVQQGAHTLEVVRPGYRAERLELKVAADEELDVVVRLESG